MCNAGGYEEKLQLAAFDRLKRINRWVAINGGIYTEERMAPSLDFTDQAVCSVGGVWNWLVCEKGALRAVIASWGYTRLVQYSSKSF